MINKNKILFVLLIFVTCIALFLNFKKYILDKDYILYMHIPCTETGECFLVEDALDDEIFNDDPYLKMYRNNQQVEYCVETGTCDEFVCGIDETDCEIIKCSEETIEEDEICV